MTWWKRLFERRDIITPGLTWSDFSNVGPTAAGVTVTPHLALTVPAVYGCVSVLSQDVGRTPLKLRRKVADDTYIDAVDHDLYDILGSLANPETTAYSFKLSMMTDLLEHERAYAEIVRVDGRVQALWRLDPTLMQVDRTPERVKRYRYGSQVWLFDPSQPPIFELRHPSPIHRCRDVIGSAAALQTYVGRFFANGARPTGVLQSPGVIGKQVALDLKTQWQSIYGQSGSNPRGVAVLEGGLDFKPIAQENDSAQLIETLHALNAQIAGTFRIPPWKLGDLTSTNYSNMESGELSYVTSTLDPYFIAWEDALRRDVLSARQYGSYTIQFDRQALIRNDVKSLHESLAVGRNTGFYSVNDCRRKLGENPIGPEGDQYLVNSALQPVGAPREPNIA
jgi:HK97 family phage portal protein